MPEITIKNLSNRTINTTVGINIFNAIINEGIDWMHACGTKGKCTTCKFVVLNGIDNLSTKTEVEKNYQKINRLNKNERLACQSAILDDITVLVPESSKMPHMKYSN